MIWVKLAADPMLMIYFCGAVCKQFAGLASSISRSTDKSFATVKRPFPNPSMISLGALNASLPVVCKSSSRDSFSSKLAWTLTRGGFGATEGSQACFKGCKYKSPISSSRKGIGSKEGVPAILIREAMISCAPDMLLFDNWPILCACMEVGRASRRSFFLNNHPKLQLCLRPC